jgi:hypothetical protein
MPETSFNTMLAQMAYSKQNRFNIGSFDLGDFVSQAQNVKSIKK